MQKVTGHRSHVPGLSLGRPGFSISFGKDVKLSSHPHSLSTSLPSQTVKTTGVYSDTGTCVQAHRALFP